MRGQCQYATRPACEVQYIPRSGMQSMQSMFSCQSILAMSELAVVGPNIWKEVGSEVVEARCGRRSEALGVGPRS